MSAPLEGFRILVIEDDFYLATDQQHMLEQAGATVIGPTGDREKAAQLAKPSQVDCAVVDINLGRGPSFELAAMLSKRGIPYIFTTGYDAAAIPSEFSTIVRLEKPVRNREAIAALRQLARPCAELPPSTG
jgi:DNA-binding NarL/FixJ family response regulator